MLVFGIGILCGMVIETIAIVIYSIFRIDDIDRK